VVRGKKRGQGRFFGSPEIKSVPNRGWAVFQGTIDEKNKLRFLVLGKFRSPKRRNGNGQKGGQAVKTWLAEFGAPYYNPIKRLTAEAGWPIFGGWAERPFDTIDPKGKAGEKGLGEKSHIFSNPDGLKWQAGRSRQFWAALGVAI